MDRSKIIDAFERCFCEEHEHCPGCYQDGPGFGIECRNALCMDVLTLLKEQKDSCWISVKDKLPTQNANVLWWCVLRDRYMGHVRIGFYEGITNHDIPEVSCCGPNCIPLYWMPMPNAPTEAAIDASGNWCCADVERKE